MALQMSETMALHNVSDNGNNFCRVSKTLCSTSTTPGSLINFFYNSIILRQEGAEGSNEGGGEGGGGGGGGRFIG